MNRVAKKAQSVPNSPSAWALSPGRSPPTPIWSPSPPPAAVVGQSKTKTKSGSGGGVSGVLKYFVRQKKVTRAQEEQIRRYRVVNNGLLQWRFANARAEAAMAAAKILAENKLYNGRIKIMKMRNSNMGKRIELQKLKHEIKVDGIIREEIYLLKEWAKLETRNSAAVGKLGITLSAVSNRLPFVHGAKVELGSIYAALRIAIQLMGDIKETISKFIYKAEEMRYLLAQVSRTMKREKECLEQMGRIVSIIAVPEALREQSLRIHLMQATKNFED